MSRTRFFTFCLALFSCVLILTPFSFADTGSKSARPMIAGPISGPAVSLHEPPIMALKTANDLGRLQASRELNLRLVTKPSAEQQLALDEFIKQTRTPGNPNYGQTLTPSEYI